MPILGERTGGRPVVDVSDAATPGGRCPACGEPLFPWVEAADADPASRVRHALDRCENCGLVLAREDGGEGIAALIERAEREVRERGASTIEAPNAASLGAAIAGEDWSGIEVPARPALLTPRALELLLGHESLEISSLRYPAAAGMAATWQTILNLISFNRDFARSALSRRLRPRDSRAGRPGFAIDVLVTVFAAIPTAALAVLLEGAAILVRRGTILRAEISPRRAR